MRLSARVDRLEAYAGDLSLAGLSDEELEARLAHVSEQLRSIGWQPACGWDAPLLQLTACLEKELAQ